MEVTGGFHQLDDLKFTGSLSKLFRSNQDLNQQYGVLLLMVIFSNLAPHKILILAPMDFIFLLMGQHQSDKTNLVKEIIIHQ